MSDNLPKSVRLAIRAATADIVSVIRGSDHNSTSVDSRFAKNIEGFLLGIVVPHYANLKAKWVDSSVDVGWVTAADVNVIDGMKLQEAFKTQYKDLDPDDAKLLEGNNFSKYNGQGLAKLQKGNPKLYDVYVGMKDGAPIDDMGLPKEPSKLDLPPAAPVAPKPSKDNDEPPAKQELMQPGVVKNTPGDMEFEKGIPSSHG